MGIQNEDGIITAGSPTESAERPIDCSFDISDLRLFLFPAIPCGRLARLPWFASKDKEAGRCCQTQGKDQPSATQKSPRASSPPLGLSETKQLPEKLDTVFVETESLGDDDRSSQESMADSTDAASTESEKKETERASDDSKRDIEESR